MFVYFFTLILIVCIYHICNKLKYRYNSMNDLFRKYVLKNYKNRIILSILSKSYIPLSQNLFFTFTQRFKIKNHLYLAFDYVSYTMLKNICGNNIYYYNINLSDNYKCRYGTECYGLIIRNRLHIINQLIELNYRVLIIDPDIHFFKNPLKFFSNCNFDIVAASDGKRWMNAGFLYNNYNYYI